MILLRPLASALLPAILFAAPALAAPAPSAPPAAAEPMTPYVVRSGDTHYALSSRYFISKQDYRAVRKQNHVARTRQLKVGLTLQIPTGLLRTTPIEGRLGAYKGAVSITLAGAAVPVAEGAVIAQGALIATGANSFARLDLPDGSRVAVPSQSRLRIDALHRTLLTGAVARLFTVEAGRSESTVVPLPQAQDSYIVRTPVSVSAVRGTDFRVGYSPEEHKASTGVVAGKVAVDADGGGSALVPASFGVSAGPGPGGGTLSVVPLLPAPKLLTPGKIQDAPRLTFDVAPTPQAHAYRAQLALDGGFQELFAETTSDKPHLEFDALPDGIYFVRVTAIDGNDLEGLPTTYTVERELNTLAPGAVAATGKKHDLRFLFRWEAGGKGERTFRFQLVRDGDKGPPVIDEAGLKDPQITVTNLPPGVYQWRVMSATLGHDHYIEKWSAPQQFNIGG
jgi:hypothetical protein